MSRLLLAAGLLLVLPMSVRQVCAQEPSKRWIEEVASPQYVSVPALTQSDTESPRAASEPDTESGARTGPPTVDSAISGMLRYLGGHAAIGRLQSLAVEAACSGPNGPFRTWVDSVRPNRVHFRQISGRGETEIWSTPDRTWSRDEEGSAREQPAAVRSFARAHEFHLLLLELDRRFSQFRIVDAGEEGEADCLGLAMTDESGEPASLCLDPLSHRPLHMELHPRGAAGAVRIAFHDWRPVDDLRLFWAFDMEEGDERHFRYDYVRVDPNSVPKDVFETPGPQLMKSAVGARPSEPVLREEYDGEIDGRAREDVAGELEVHELASDVFGNVRKLRVWLPSGYSESANRERSYPVLYLNDGQNVFDAATAVFGSHEWRADETAGELIAQGRVKPMVIVGIDNAGRRGRAKEYLPYPDEFLEPPEPDPRGRLYGRFLAEEVIPFVERRFRVARSPEGRALGGSSYGALIALYVAADRPGLFSRLLLESPSFYVAENRVLRETEPEGLRLRRVYLGVGTNELALEGCPAEHEGNMEAVNGVRRAAELLRRAGLAEGRELKVVVESCARHGEAAWARRFPTALEFLFAAR